jgi:hypothetical protein
MTVDLSLFNHSVTTFLDHFTSHYGEEAELETYVICARVKCPNIPGGSALSWIVSPGGDEHAAGLLHGVLEALDGDGGTS